MPEDVTVWQRLRERLGPLTEWIPDPWRELFPVEVWWLFQLVALLLALLIVGHAVRGLLRGLLRGLVALIPRRKLARDAGMTVDLSRLPPPPEGRASLEVYQVPARVRLVVVAPVGKHAVLEPRTVGLLLERAIPGLGRVLLRDQPEVYIWPPQFSVPGFTNSFHRCTPTGQAEDQASRWILLAGRLQAGDQPLFVGLALWAERATRYGRRNPMPDEWLGVVRLTDTGTTA